MKKIFRNLIIIVVVMLLAVPASAQGYKDEIIRSSSYLNAYGVLLSQSTNHRLCITADVTGTGIMSKIGVSEIYIEEYSSSLGAWTEFDVWYGINNPNTFYEYNNYYYSNQFYFTGTPGNSYRVTITAFAMNSNGSDTGMVTSAVRTCP